MKTTGYPSRLMALGRVLAGAFRPGGGGLRVQLAAAWRMSKATFSGSYTGMSRGTLAMLALGAAYVVSPVDLVPEAALAIFGLVDDTVLAVWLVGTLAAETERFRSWEIGTSATGPVVEGEVVEGEIVRPH
jgi:uncharacterized membrane protein YkvA (DUF1232 family)